MRTGHFGNHVWIIVPLHLCLAACCFADPPGFKKIQITDTPDDVEFWPTMNNLGHIVWSSRIGGFGNRDNEEIYLYRDGVTTRLTDDSVPDAGPDINDHDAIVWSHFSGPDDEYGPTGEIARWTDGVVDYLTDDDASDVGARIANDGNIVWYRYINTGCASSDMRLEFFDGTQIVDLTDGAHSDQGAAINDSDFIVWTRYNFCKSPWRSAVWMRDADGNTTQLGSGFEPQGATISTNGLVAWADDNSVYEWDNGTVTKITDDGIHALINSHGDIAFARWNDSARTWESWLYLGGETRQIAASTDRNTAYDMNERGDIITLTYDRNFDHSEVILYQRLPTGDMNCDEQVNFEDIDGFVDAITDRASYESHNPNCDWWLADCNGDRHVDFNDIDPFVTCLINNGCP